MIRRTSTSPSSSFCGVVAERALAAALRSCSGIACAPMGGARLRGESRWSPFLGGRDPRLHARRLFREPAAGYAERMACVLLQLRRVANAVQRILEPELMLDPAQAQAYASADFEEPHSRFITLLRE